MSNDYKYVARYCGYLVEVLKIKEFVKDPQRGLLARVAIRYEDGFENGALLGIDEIKRSYA